MFDLKKEGWYIATNNRAEYAAAQEYLFTQGFEWYCKGQAVSYNGQESYGETACIVHCGVDGISLGYSSYGWATNADNELKEIKLTFKTIVDSVEYPETVTPEQQQLAQVMQKLDDLKSEAEQLQAIINKGKV